MPTKNNTSPATYKKVDIHVTENGFIVQPIVDAGNLYGRSWTGIDDPPVQNKLVFKDLKSLTEWLNENLQPTAEQKRFLDGLATESKCEDPKCATTSAYASTPMVTSFSLGNITYNNQGVNTVVSGKLRQEENIWNTVVNKIKSYSKP